MKKIRKAIKVILIIIILVGASKIGFDFYQKNEAEKQRLHNMALQLKEANSKIKIEVKKTNEQLKKELIEEMLDTLASYEGKNEKLDQAGELNYANDPVVKNFTACRQIGGWRKSECDSWTKYRWTIATAQHFYKKEYGREINEKEMLQKLLDDEWADEFTARVIINNKGAIWHWHGATKTEDRKTYFRTIIKVIRKL